MKNNVKSMAKLFPAVLASTLMLSLTACGSAAKEPVNVGSEVSTESEIEVENIESEKTEVAIDSTKVPDVSKEETEEEEIAKEVAEKVEEIKEETKEEVKVDEEKTKVETTTPSKEVGESTNTTPSETTPSTPIETPVYEGTSYYTNTQTPMHLANDGERWYYVVDSFNRYALNDIDNGAWIDIHGDDFDAWYEIECGRAIFKDGVYTPYPGNGDFLQMNDFLNIDGQGGPAPGLGNPISRHPEGGGCYYFNYNTDYSYVSTTFRIWDREILALITPDYLGVENLLYNAMFSDTVYFGENADQPEYVGNTKIEYLGKQADCEFSYIFRISQR